MNSINPNNSAISVLSEKNISEEIADGFRMESHHCLKPYHTRVASPIRSHSVEKPLRSLRCLQLTATLRVCCAIAKSGMHGYHFEFAQGQRRGLAFAQSAGKRGRCRNAVAAMLGI